MNSKSLKIEIKHRDGLAREGYFQAGTERLLFPAALDPEYFPVEFTISPLTNVPLTAPQEFVHHWEQVGSNPVLIHPYSSRAGPHGAIVCAANWHTALGNPRAYVEWLIRLRALLAPDSLRYVPAAALPSNVAFLILSGFDLFDYRGVDLKAAQGMFCTVEGEFPVAEWLDSGVCNCPGCLEGDPVRHNRYALEQEIAVVRRFILRGQLRELVEQRCRHSTFQVAALRLLDGAYEKIRDAFPVTRVTPLLANSGESLRRPEVRLFAERVVGRFVPSRTDVAVLLPCSARKPYSGSQSHRLFRQAIANRAHELIVTSPLGVVPRELEEIYPAAHYDVPVTGYWDREEVALLGELLARYFEQNRYSRVIAHLDGGSLKVAEMAAERCGINLEVTCRDRPTSPDSLNALADSLEGEMKRRHDIVQGVASWQFGTLIDTTGCMVKGRYERRRVLRKKTQLFSIDSDTGLLKPTLEGWDLIGDRYRVHIDDFVPQGDVLVPGVLECDPEILEGDEVFVMGKCALATGRAVMGAKEIQNSSRGIAVKVRKVKRLEH